MLEGKVYSCYSSEFAVALYYLEEFMICQTTRYSDKFVVVQVKFPQMRDIGQSAVVHNRDAVEAQTQSATESRNE